MTLTEQFHQADQVVDSLTIRQRAVLAGLGRGLSIDEIAAEMKITRRTVHYFCQCIKETIGLRSVPHMMLYAVYSGIAQLPRKSDAGNNPTLPVC